HFAVPFAAFTALGIKPKKAFLPSLFALLPDLDILVSIHRFCSHSLILLLAISIPLMLIAMKFNRQKLLSLIIFAYISHLFLDLFMGYTPILWPLHSQDLWINLNLFAHLSSTPTYTLQATIQTQPTTFTRFTSLDAPLFTSTGIAISILLVVPTTLATLKFK
ncbi:TPA: metal-dependent hydrolase, partial [Candidatus Bathyarchaeota archaeon]|nr:metal-dependent hydrolase [Candidatus Bathyarchaeota archaeon]